MMNGMESTDLFTEEPIEAPKGIDLGLYCAKIVIDKKASNNLLFEVGKLGAFTDYFLITSGSNEKQTQAIAESLYSMAKNFNLSYLSMEGFDDGRWILVDLGSVVIHIFLDTIRDFYNLEEIWGQAPRVRIPEEYYTSPSQIKH